MTGDKEPREVAVAIIYERGSKQVLMITSRKHPHLWILPKGGIEKGESSGQAAVRESWEEAGTPKSLIPPTDDERLLMLSLEPGTSKRRSIWYIHIVRTTESAVAEVKDWPEKDERQRAWFSPSDALVKIREWYSDPKAAEGASNGTEVLDIKKGKQAKKKELKGGAMETAFKAFMDSEGL